MARSTGSLHTDAPGATVTSGLPPKATGLFEPLTTAGPPRASPAWTPSTESGFVPNALEKRSRARRPHTSGRTIMRKVWLRAPFAGMGNAKRWSGCADGLPTGYGPCTEAAQVVTHF